MVQRIRSVPVCTRQSLSGSSRLPVCTREDQGSKNMRDVCTPQFAFRCSHCTASKQVLFSQSPETRLHSYVDCRSSPRKKEAETPVCAPVRNRESERRRPPFLSQGFVFLKSDHSRPRQKLGYGNPNSMTRADLHSNKLPNHLNHTSRSTMALLKVENRPRRRK